MKMSIGQKIMLFGILPSIATGFFIYVVLVDKFSIKKDADSIVHLSEYIATASSLVHELQKERGASAVYVASKGGSMKEELASQKQRTDNALTSLHAVAEQFDAREYSSDLNTKIAAAMGILNNLASKRDSISSLSVSKDDAIAFYTSVNTAFIQSFEQVALLATHKDISAAAHAYVNLMSAKELAGIERAVIGGIVGINTLVEIADLDKWMTVWKGSDRLLQNFEYLASKDALNRYKSNLSGPIVSDVSEIRKVLLKKANTGDFGITGKAAFDAATRRIDAMKTVEDYQSEELKSIASGISSDAKNGIVVYIAISATSIIAVVVLNLLNKRLATRITTLFKGVIKDLTENASQVASASSQISASSQCLSEATTEQAASIEETSATMEQISSMTTRNADNAGEAATLSSACNSHANEGSNTVGDMDKAMSDICESSTKIANIIQIIEGIAFQTNLLALNAAVEAARAGEHGRGFAVVAEEVRNLAQRSASAAKDITSLITDSVKKAETGKDLVRKTKEVFSGVATQVKKVADLVNEIAAASDEQKNGVTQISKAIQQMDQAIQQNAANAEETAASSAELSEQAKGLNVLIERVAAEINVGENSAHATMQYAPRSNAVEKRRSIPVVQNRFSPITKSKTGGNGGNGTHKYAALSRNASPQQLIPLDNDGFGDF